MSRALTIDDVRTRLAAPDLPEVLTLLGFEEADARDGLALAQRIVHDRTALERIVDRSGALLDRLGDLLGETGGYVWRRDGARAGEGDIALCTFLVTIPEVRAYHQGRGIAEAISWKSLADLGHQVAVHRLTYGQFGLHTHDWLINAWTGRLYWLGRLQFTIEKADGGILASAHIPRTGSFAAAAVDAAIARVEPFFTHHFPELLLRGLHCKSWLLDPQLSQELSPSSNIVTFSQRWDLTSERESGDADVLFFVFSRRGDPQQVEETGNPIAGIDLDGLPQDTSLQRAVVTKLRDGGRWQVRTGYLPLPGESDETAAEAPPVRRGEDLTAASGADPESLVRTFHEVFDIPVGDGTPDVRGGRVPMRMTLIAEEFAELVGAVYGAPAQKVMDRAFTRAIGLDESTRDIVATADALGDLVYVLYGMALECGIPLAHVLAEIQDSNLSKLGPDRRPLLREDGKVLKGPDFHDPDLESVLLRADWRN